MNERVIGLDVGDVRIGVAASDPGRLIASPLGYIRRVGWGPDVRQVLAYCEQYDTRIIVCGLPRNMDGSEGFQAEKVQQFCVQLEKAGLTVYHQDERLTTVTAERALLQDGMRRGERKQHVDSVAAAVILQQWLDSERTRPTINTTEETAMSEQNENNLLELIDENGDTVTFEMVASLEREGKEYLALMLPDEDEESEEAEIVFMQVEIDENDQDSYVSVEDEELQAQLFDQLLELMDQEDEEG